MDFRTIQTAAGRPSGRWFPQLLRNLGRLDLLFHYSFETRFNIPKKTPGVARQNPSAFRKNPDPTSQVIDGSRVMAEKKVVFADYQGYPELWYCGGSPLGVRNQRGGMFNPFKGASHERRPPLLRPFRA
jgi:hypothetical protein